MADVVSRLGFVPCTLHLGVPQCRDMSNKAATVPGVAFECSANYFLCISRAMEDLQDNTTVFSTLRSLNNFISQRMEGVSGLATPGSSQSSMQAQYQQRMQVRCPQLGVAYSVASVWL